MSDVAVLSRSTCLDVICVGEAGPVTGSAVRTAITLGRSKLRVGLCAALPDEPLARTAMRRLEAHGIEIEGVTHALNFCEIPVPVPDGWSADAMVISGVTPAMVPLARMCRDVRRFRRGGGMTVIDLNARHEVWRDHDARVLHALLREAHVVRCSTADAMALWTDLATLRAVMNPAAILVVTDGPGPARAHGPFGDCIVAPSRTSLARLRPGAGDAFTASVVAELIRPTAPTAWDRVLTNAHAAAWAFGAR